MHNNNSRPKTMTNVANNIINRFKPQTDNQHITSVRLIGVQPISSGATGVINTVFANNPNGTSEWASYIALYDEFRILAVRLSILPYQQGSLTVISDLCGIVFDNDDTTVLTNISSALEYDNCRLIQTNWVPAKAGLTQYTWARPTSGANTAVLWQDVAVPAASPGSIKFYASGLSASTKYFSVQVEYFVEFRGRR
jgi:hypothetical protein